MADIFISYSKPDRDQVVMLSAYLESEGWTVWWDTNLNPGDLYRDEIMLALAGARAVIVLWTPHSIKSDFVRAEAGQAKAQAKLIPVKEASVLYGDIPLPFGEMHTEDLAKRELIRAAVVAQLAKPQERPNILWAASKTLRYQVLTWFGIVGGAITLFANLRGVLDLADWARLLATHWQAWATLLWSSAFGWMGISVPPVIVPLLSFAAFAFIMSLGVRLRLGPPPSSFRMPPRAEIIELSSAFGFITLLTVGVMYFYVPQFFTLSTLLPTLIFTGFIWFYNLFFKEQEDAQSYLFMALFAFMSITIIGPKLMFITLVHAVRPTPETKMAYDLFSPLPSFGVVLFTVGPFLMTVIAPVRGLVRRLAFSVIGTILLAVLNQLSLYGPLVRELLLPPRL